MLLNGILYNSEAWHGVTMKQIATLEAIDEALLRGILKAHSKTPKEFLYLELGALPIKWIMAQRRINYLKQIMLREDNELLKKVLIAQKNSPSKGDFVTIVEKDLKSLNLTYEQVTSSQISKIQLKKLLRQYATNAAFKELTKKLEKHTKVKDIKYERLEMQQYLKSENLTSEETHVLAAVRSKCVRNVKMNFRKMYKDNVNCPLECNKVSPEIDDQNHILTCTVLNPVVQHETVLGDVFEEGVEQETSAKVFSILIRQRKRLLDKKHNLPGDILDQCAPRGAASVLVV
jgi:hypothetical protein